MLLWAIVGAGFPGVALCDGGVRNEISGLLEYRSTNGVLYATLEAKPQTVLFSNSGLGVNTSVNGLTYNGEYAGPVLRVHPGDVMHITLINHLSEPTNLHFHGLHTTPQGHGDNVHIKVYPGQSFEYVIPIPSTQPPGLYWYHAHLHGMSEEQVMGGLSGALVIEGFQEQFPELANVSEHIFILKDHVFEHSRDPVIHDILHDRVESANGQLFSEITMQPGETQLWRFTNQSANLYFHIALKGHTFRIIGNDGVSATRETIVKTLDIMPAGRMEVLVTAGEPGEYSFVAERSPIGTSGAYTLDRVIGKLTVAGEKDTPVADLVQFPEKENLLRRKVDKYRVITFSENVPKNAYYVNDRLYDEDRMDIRVPLGNVEEWSIRNDSNDLHVFHIHQVHFQVVEINGVPQLFNGYADNVYVPERGAVRIRMAFTDPRILGRFVYHCHVLQHEDAGMMANIEVYDKQESQFGRLWKNMGYCCTGQFSVDCIWSNLALLAKEFL